MSTTHHVGDSDTFDLDYLISDLKHYLPSQTPLKDFIHHNSLHAFQGMKFYDGIFQASKMFGYQVTLPLHDFRELYKTERIKEDILNQVITESKGAEHLAIWKDKLLNASYDTHITSRIGTLRQYWKSIYRIDLDNQVQPLLFRILCSYLDQGVSIWSFPDIDKGFLDTLREVEGNSVISFFKTKGARALLLNEQLTIEDLLVRLVGKEIYFSQYLFDQQFSHRGWSGMVSTIEDTPQGLLDPKKISLRDLIQLELILEIDALNYQLGDDWEAIGLYLDIEVPDIKQKNESSELQEVFMLWQDAFEWSYYDEVLAGIQTSSSLPPSNITQKSFQAFFCIDERECSLRRHLEMLDPNCETLGTPGFFGVEFYFLAHGAKFYDKLCPAPVTPNYLIKEYHDEPKKQHKELLYAAKTHTLLGGFISSVGLGALAAIKLGLGIFRPSMSPATANAFSHMHKSSYLSIENKGIEDVENGLQIGFTVVEMANRVEGVLRNTGLITGFAPLVYVISHGSSSANNPHHGAHDCGACSGRPGLVNARVLAFMANHEEVRATLRARGIDIPQSTQFVGGMHDTASDQIEFYDEHVLNVDNTVAHQNNINTFESALDYNAKERSRRFASIDTKQTLKKVREEIRKRSVSLFEPRPELGHGTNSLCIVGNRNLTKRLFLDRRGFLNSYDYKTDPEGKLLLGVMRPLGPVCGGINLEYYFSRVDNYKLGAGTKLPHNVMGLIGVSNSSDGDLRPGLPLQMIEVHDPVRLLIIVEHFPEVVLDVIKKESATYEWFINEWVHLAVINPQTHELFYFKNGLFMPYTIRNTVVNRLDDANRFIEEAAKMRSNHIVDATQENLPVYLLDK